MSMKSTRARAEREFKFALEISKNSEYQLPNVPRCSTLVFAFHFAGSIRYVVKLMHRD